MDDYTAVIMWLIILLVGVLSLAAGFLIGYFVC